jgi:Cu2+-containing amine oxidase
MATMLDAISSIKPLPMIHPLASLQPEEIIRARDIITQRNPGRQILWKIIAVKEPPKAQVVTYFLSNLVLF